MKTNIIFPSFAIALPSYEAGSSLVKTLQGIYQQTCISHVEQILVVTDGTSVSDQIREKIAHPKLQIVEFSKRKGQAGRINDIFSLVSADILILTNDDVIIKPDAIEQILRAMVKKKADLVGVKMNAISLKNTLQKVINSGIIINEKIGLLWNHGDNYLLSNGRLLGLSSKLYRNVSIPELIWNNDAYLYLFAKENRYTFYYERSAVASFALPSKFSEHLMQSKKFQNSKSDNQRYFKNDIHQYYVIPYHAKFLGFIYGFTQKPLWTTLYICEFLYSRFKPVPKSLKNYRVGYWETDLSTKILD